MEERSYSLYGAETKTAIRVLAAMFAGVPAIETLVGGFMRGAVFALCGLGAMLVGSAFVWLLRLLSKSTLHVSDQGIVETSLWSKPISITWDEICDVSTREERLSL